MNKEEITIKALEIAESKTDVRYIQELISDSCEEMAEWTMEQYENQGYIVVHTENLTDEQRLQIATHIAEYLTENGIKGE